MEKEIETKQKPIEFDYIDVKSRYLSRMKKYTKRNDPVTWVREDFDKFIAISKLSANDRSAEQNELVESVASYEIVKENDTYILLVPHTSLEVLPYDDCFDVFVDAHLIFTEHGNMLAMCKVLHKSYFFMTYSLEAFLDSCNVCENNMKDDQALKKIANTGASLFNDAIYLDVIEKPCIGPDLDEGFSHLLIYQDIGTKYILLRPIITQDKGDIAAELFKIFIDFGTPKYIYVTKNLQNYSVVLKIVERAIHFKYTIVLDTVNFHTSDIVSGQIKKWMRQINSQKWSVGCYIVQYKLNEATSSINKVFNRNSDEKAESSPSNNQEIKKNGNVNISRENTDEETDEDCIILEPPDPVIEIHD